MKQSYQWIKFIFAAIILSLSSVFMAHAQSNEVNPDKISGKVVETIDSGNYTYVQVDTGEAKLWAASPPVKLEPGTMVSFVPNMPMPNFTSKTLDRTFDVVYFVARILTDKVATYAAVSETGGSTDQSDVTINVDNIKKAANGITVEEALSKNQKLSGQTIRIRGVVVKYTEKVMNRNWIHIRDASSEKNLTVTTTDTVKKGDVILASGKMQFDKDFGFGYSYDVLIEDSTVIVE